MEGLRLTLGLSCRHLRAVLGALQQRPDQSMRVPSRLLLIGGFVACTLRLEQEAGFKVVLNSSSCDAHGNLFRVTSPVTQTLTEDGCYDQIGKQIVFAAAFPAGTEISAEVVAPRLANAPQLRVSGSYPEWTLTFEDGVDQDFNDLVMTLTALPTGQ